MQWLHGKIVFDFSHAKKAIEQKQIQMAIPRAQQQAFENKFYVKGQYVV